MNTSLGSKATSIQEPKEPFNIFDLWVLSASNPYVLYGKDIFPTLNIIYRGAGGIAHLAPELSVSGREIPGEQGSKARPSLDRFQ
jgi:hypothetical protein